MKRRKNWIKSTVLAVIGGFVGFLVGGAVARGVVFALDWEKLNDHVTAIGQVLLAISLLASLYFYVNSRADVKRYEECEDDEFSDELYRKLNLDNSYLIVATGVSVALSLLLVMMGLRATPETLKFPIFAYAALFISGGLQVLAIKLYNRFRGTNVPITASVKELKANILQQDEAELMANYKMAFDIVMTLNGHILPMLYIVLALLSQLTGQTQLVAFLCVGLIHLYILARNIKMAREFYQ